MIPEDTEATDKIHPCLGRTTFQLKDVLNNSESSKVSSKIIAVSGNTITVESGDSFEIGMEIRTPGIRGSTVVSKDENTVTIDSGDGDIMPAVGDMFVAVRGVISTKERTRKFSREIYMDMVGISTETTRKSNNTSSDDSSSSSSDEEDSYSSSSYSSSIEKKFSINKMGKGIAFTGITDNGERFSLVYEPKKQGESSSECVSTLLQSSCRGTLTRFNTDESRVLVAEASEFGTGNSFFGVDQIILFQPAQSWSEHKQWIGRVLRSCDQPALHVRGRKQGSIEVITLVGKMKGNIKSADQYAWESLENMGQELENSLLNNIKKKAIEYGKKWGYWKKVKDVQAKWQKGQKSIQLKEGFDLNSDTKYGLKHMGLHSGTTIKSNRLNKKTKQNAKNFKTVSVYQKHEVSQNQLIYDVNPSEFEGAEGCTSRDLF